MLDMIRTPKLHPLAVKFVCPYCSGIVELAVDVRDDEGTYITHSLPTCKKYDTVDDDNPSTFSDFIASCRQELAKTAPSSLWRIFGCALLLILAGCTSTLESIVRRDEKETHMCGAVTWTGHVVETCDLRLPWYGRPQWVNCRQTVETPLGFRATTYE
jgi:hypothetical protein